MHILITGAAGMLGRKLTARLVADATLAGREITRLSLLDVVEPAAPDGFAGQVTRRAARRRGQWPTVLT
jgi:nucleoside-diphosphate-sugar epimerase